MRKLFLLAILLLGMVWGYGQRTLPIFRQQGSDHLAGMGDSVNRFLQVQQYKAIIYGETHTVYFEPDMKYLLIEQLQPSGVHDVFMEIGHAAAWLFNQYLRTGDTALLTNPVLPYYWAKGYYALFWQKLYTLNQSLPEADKIVIHGTDFERVEAFKTLLLLRPAGQEVPVPLQSLMASIELYSQMPYDRFDKELVAALEQVQKSILQNESVAAVYYGNNWKTVQRIINNPAKHTGRVPARNQTMYQAIISTMQEKHITQMVGFFGAAHTLYTDRQSVSSRLAGQLGQGAVLNISSVIYEVNHSSSPTPLPWVGQVKEKESLYLQQTYLPKQPGVIMVKSEIITEGNLRRAADVLVLASDRGVRSR